MRRIWSILALTILATLNSFSVTAQDGVIVLDNPSFEDMPRHSKTPRYWSNCGVSTESPPDIQPDYTFQVSTPAFDGNTYLGMVVRDNDTWELVGQLLNNPLEAKSCYSFSIKLARSLTYYSVSRETGSHANYIQPIKLRIWGGTSMCDKAELLDESPLVSNTDWMEYQFKLEPTAKYTHIIIEAFYKTPSLFPYNGNLLLDDASLIVPIPCDEEVPEEPKEPEINEPLAVNISPKSPEAPAPEILTQTSTPQPVATPPAPEENTLAGVKHSEMKAGATITLESIQFEADSDHILESSIPTVEELYVFLVNNPEVKVEVGGHTNGWAQEDYAITLSTNRAKAVADQLIAKGIVAERVRYNGYGKEHPIESNETAAGRRKNQRVEIKILDI